jgi:hypothetical protein
VKALSSKKRKKAPHCGGDKCVTGIWAGGGGGRKGGYGGAKMIHSWCQEGETDRQSETEVKRQA